jgi:NADH dehydrogenase FAD-containing subunit
MTRWSLTSSAEAASETLDRQRILILGGGFAGVYTAMRLERRLRRRDDVDVSLVSRDNAGTYYIWAGATGRGDVGEYTLTVGPRE